MTKAKKKTAPAPVAEKAVKTVEKKQDGFQPVSGKKYGKSFMSLKKD